MKQYATFEVNGRLYGIDVIDVQEVTRTLALTRVPLAPAYVSGLMNLRGQIAPAINLRKYFDPSDGAALAPMTVVCRSEDGLVSLLVDRIGDVVEASADDYEAVPEHVDGRIRQVLSGVYKLENNLLSIIELKKIVFEMDQKEHSHVA